MSITVTCPSCKQTFKVKDDMAGRRGKCPTCKGKIDVPPLNAPTSVQAPPAAPSKNTIAPGLPRATQRTPPTMRCPGCQEEIATDPGMAGQTVSCPHCDHQFEMPGKAKSRPVQPKKTKPVQSDSEDDAEPSPAQPTPKPSGAGFGLSITGMVLGITGLVISVIPCINWGGLLLAVLGIIFSAIGLSLARKTGHGKGMAIAGLSTSGVALVWLPLAIFFMAALFASCCCAPLGFQMDTKDKKNNPFPMPQPIVKKDGPGPSKLMSTLQLKFEPGQLFLNGMELFVDDKKIPQFQIAFPGQFSLPLSEGKHSIAIRLKDDNLFTKDVMILPGAQSPVIVQVPRLENPNPAIKK